ncbi:biotin--[acetyl-CoA-carboxylase] ligase [Candidatus Pacearchaeota archaeon]|nr:MAG: biotin--[acetyl-CoA-carboxylase] ligase [Candidatus Pacearchaeota archaeon]
MKSRNLRVQILTILQKNLNFVSGAKLAKKLNVSRVTIWKHIKKLKEKGYPIEITKKGYKLLMNKDIIFEDKLKELPYKVYYFQEVTSTMDIAREKAENEEKALILAETQTSGKGRLARMWYSPPGGIWMSLIIKPNLNLKESYILTYIASISTALAIKDVTGLKVKLKWPNDIVYEEKKLAGILLEIKAEVDKIQYAIIGIGINVNNKISNLENQAISLKEILKKDISRTDIIINLVKYFDKFIKKNSNEILKSWKEMSCTLGREVKILTTQEIIKGIAFDLSEDGALMIKDKFGNVHKIYSGDCIHLRKIEK